MFVWLFLLLLLVVMMGYLKFWWSHRRILATASRLPCPPTIPIFGNALYFLGNVASITENLIKFTTEFKELFCLWVGPMPIFVVSNPKDVQVVLNSSSTLEKDDVYKLLKTFGMGNGLLTAPVHIWKKSRRVLMPIFHSTNIELYLPEFNSYSKQLCRQLGKDQPVDPRYNLFHTAVDAVSGTLFSKRTLSHNLKMKLHSLLDLGGSMFTFRLFKVWLQIDWLFHTIYRSDLKKALSYLTDFLTFIDEELRVEELRSEKISESDRDSRLSLADVVRQQRGVTISDDHHWHDEVITIGVGATDTVVESTSFLLVSLANHPQIQARIREEITEVMGDSSADTCMADLEKLKYLECAILEAMRLHGVFPAVIRKATKDTILNKSSSNNSTLPAGSRILVALHAMGMDPDRFPEPKKFRPERFLNTSEEEQEDRSFFPFSRGPRNCPGKSYSMMLIKTVIVHILRQYHLTTTVKLEDIEYDLKVVMCSKTPLLITFQPIKDS